MRKALKTVDLQQAPSGGIRTLVVTVVRDEGSVCPELPPSAGLETQAQITEWSLIAKGAGLEPGRKCLLLSPTPHPPPPLPPGYYSHGNPKLLPASAGFFAWESLENLIKSELLRPLTKGFNQ